VRRADNLTTFMYRLSKNTGSLNLMQPQGPEKEIALPLFVHEFSA